MADPRFYDNRGPFRLAELCEAMGLDCPPSADHAASVFDVAGLGQAGPPHLSFFDGRRGKEDFFATKAGWCLVGDKPRDTVPPNTVLLACAAVGRVFGGIARKFYPEHEIDDEALNYIGDRLMTGDRNAGIALFELNVRDHPRSSRAHEFLAEAYAADGRNALAIQSYERAVALDPKNDSARKKLATLQR